ncbi:MAG: DinB family protein [Vicinamibacterales bacterium]
MTLLLTAWDDLDRAVADVTDADMLRQIESGSCFAWTVAHVTYGVDSWINRRFLEMQLNPVLSNPRFDYGGDGGADDWPAIRDAVADVRDRLRPFLLTLTDADLDENRPYDGGHPAFRERGYINLRVAIIQNAIHHVFHLGEIVAKRELMGYNAGDFPGAFSAALLDRM